MAIRTLLLPCVALCSLLSATTVHAQDPDPEMKKVEGYACPLEGDACMSLSLADFVANRKNFKSPYYPFKGTGEEEQKICDIACKNLDLGAGYCCNDRGGRTQLMTASDCYEQNPRDGARQDRYIFLQQKRIAKGDYESQGIKFVGDVENYEAACSLYYCCHGEGYFPAINDKKSCPADTVPSPVFKDGVKRDNETACKDVKKGGFGVCCIPSSADPQPLKDKDGNPQLSPDGGKVYGMTPEDCSEQYLRKVTGASVTYFRVGRSFGVGEEPIVAYGETTTIPKQLLVAQPNGMIAEEDAKRVCDYNYKLNAPDLQYMNRGVCCNFDDYSLSEGHKTSAECDAEGRNPTDTISPPWSYSPYHYFQFRENGPIFLEGDKNGDRTISSERVAISAESAESYNYCKSMDSFICCRERSVRSTRPNDRKQCRDFNGTVVPIGMISGQKPVLPDRRDLAGIWGHELSDREWNDFVAFQTADAGRNIGMEETKQACALYGVWNWEKQPKEDGLCCYRRSYVRGTATGRKAQNKDHCEFMADNDKAPIIRYVDPSNPMWEADIAEGRDADTVCEDVFAGVTTPSTRPARGNDGTNRGVCCYRSENGFTDPAGRCPGNSFFNENSVEYNVTMNKEFVEDPVNNPGGEGAINMGQLTYMCGADAKFVPGKSIKDKYTRPAAGPPRPAPGPRPQVNGTAGGNEGGGVIGGGGGAGMGGFDGDDGDDDDDNGGFLGGGIGGTFGGGGLGGSNVGGGGRGGMPGFGGGGFPGFGGFGFPGTIGGFGMTGVPGIGGDSGGSDGSEGSEASVESGDGESSASAGTGETGDTGAGEAGAAGGVDATGVTGAAGGRGGELNGSGEESSVPDEGESEGGENREEPPAPSGIGGVIGGSGDAGAVGGSGEPRVVPAPGPRPAPAPRSASAASASASSAGGGMGAQLTGFVGGGGAAVGAAGVALFAGAGIGLLQWRNHSRVVTRKKTAKKRRKSVKRR